MKISRIKIEKIQAQKKLTQREIATLLGCSPNFICMIWRGKNISPKTLGKIADALGVNPEDILEEEGK